MYYLMMVLNRMLSLVVPKKEPMINRSTFFSELRKSTLFNKISQSQVTGIEAVLNEWEKRKLKDLRWLAYMYATDYHETDKTMQAIAEYGQGRTRRYGKKLKISGVAYTKPDKIFFGRGLVQLTWYDNYELMGRLLRIDLLGNPELALKLDVAVQVMFEGMLRGSSSVGDFTGKCLEMYFNDTTEDWINARRIINGTDKAKQIADYGHIFHDCLKKSFV